MNKVGRHDFDASLLPDGSAGYAVSSGRSALEERLAGYAENLVDPVSGKIPDALVLPRACPMCGCDRGHRPLMVKYHVPIVACGRCRFWFAAPLVRGTLGGDPVWDDIWNTAHIQFLTSETYRLYSERRYAYELQMVEPFVGSRREVLDIGCSVGGFLDVATSFGWRVAGVEMNEAAAAIARQRHPEVVSGMFDAERYRGRGFTLVAALDVIEHLPDPKGFLADLHGVLADDGLLLIQVPNGASLAGLLRWDSDPLYNGLIHLNYFSPDSLRRWLEECGYRLLHAETVLSELSHVRRFPVERVAAIGAERGLDLPPLPDLSNAPDAILDRGLGYKCLAVAARVARRATPAVP